MGHLQVVQSYLYRSMLGKLSSSKSMIFEARNFHGYFGEFFTWQKSHRVHITYSYWMHINIKKNIDSDYFLRWCSHVFSIFSFHPLPGSPQDLRGPWMPLAPLISSMTFRRRWVRIDPCTPDRMHLRTPEWLLSAPKIKTHPSHSHILLARIEGPEPGIPLYPFYHIYHHLPVLERQSNLPFGNQTWHLEIHSKFGFQKQNQHEKAHFPACHLWVPEGTIIFLMSMGWLTGKSTGNQRFSHEHGIIQFFSLKTN